MGRKTACFDAVDNLREFCYEFRTVVGRVEYLRKTTIGGFPALIGEASFPDRPQSLETLADISAGLLNAVSISFLGLERGAPRSAPSTTARP